MSRTRNHYQAKVCKHLGFRNLSFCCTWCMKSSRDVTISSQSVWMRCRPNERSLRAIRSIIRLRKGSGPDTLERKKSMPRLRDCNASALWHSASLTFGSHTSSQRAKKGSPNAKINNHVECKPDEIDANICKALPWSYSSASRSEDLSNLAVSFPGFSAPCPRRRARMHAEHACALRRRRLSRA